jgi:3-hydroxybutyryl-CoA dehydrogenase
MEIETVGVIGAGVMGTGLAQALAQADFRVLLLDISSEVLGAAREQITQSVRFQSLFKQSTETAQNPRVTDKITFTDDYKILRDADFVVENVTEKWTLKKEVYREIDAICPERTVFAANTSAIPIARIASATTRAAKVIGMHFMNPVPMKRMVEVIRGRHTSPETLEAAGSLLTQMKKNYVIVNDSPGFVSNRVLMLMVNEAIFLVDEGVASAEEVDLIFRECFAHKMGPLETADLIGLDTILYSIEVLHENFKNDKYRPCPLLERMVDAGLYGRKNGKGFYAYEQGQRISKET